MRVPAGQTAAGGSSASDAQTVGTLGPRAFWLALAGLILCGLLTRVVILREFLEANPLSRLLYSDPAEYWDWAARIAQGELIQDKPFLSAPLYPYLLGLLRALGGSLTTVYIAQLVAHLLTAVGLAWIGRLRFGPTAGLLAATLFLLLTEPAFDATRLLPTTLQLALLCALWLALLRAGERASLRRCALAGALLGLNCLANPPMILAIPLGGGWLAAQAGGRWSRRVGRGGVVVLAAAAVTGLATLHNWLACREFIPLTAHAGITLRQGNAPGAQGIYTPLAGVSASRRQMHRDAAELYERKTGRPARWREVDRYFAAQAWNYWRDQPNQALRLAATKLYLFVSGRNYGDIYLPAAEVTSGLARWLGRLAPLPVAWLTVPALLGCIALLRQPRRYGPELILMLIPLLVVVIFWYTPRYRAPAIPLISVLAAWCLLRAAQWRRRPAWAATAAFALAVGVGTGTLNRALAFDPLRPRLERVRVQVGDALAQQGDLPGAISILEAGLAPGRAALELRGELAECLTRAGRLEEACQEYWYALRFAPNNARLLRGFGDVLLRLRRVAEAERVLAGALQPHSGDQHLQQLLASSRRMRQEEEQRIASHQALLRRRPHSHEARLALGRALAALGRLAEARDEFEAVLRSQPENLAAHSELAAVLAEQGASEPAWEHCERALALQPRAVALPLRLGDICLRSGRLEQAARYYQRALSAEPGNQRAMRALRRVAKMRRKTTQPKP